MNMSKEIGPDAHLSEDFGRINTRVISFGTISKSYSERVIAVGEALAWLKQLPVAAFSTG